MSQVKFTEQPGGRCHSEVRTRVRRLIASANETSNFAKGTKNHRLTFPSFVDCVQQRCPKLANAMARSSLRSSGSSQFCPHNWCLSDRGWGRPSRDSLPLRAKIDLEKLESVHKSIDLFHIELICKNNREGASRTFEVARPIFAPRTGAQHWMKDRLHLLPLRKPYSNRQRGSLQSI
jgi:hypothetical protein